MVTVEGLTAFQLFVFVLQTCRFGLSWDSSDLPLSSTPSTSPVWSFLLVLIFPFGDFSILVLLVVFWKTGRMLCTGFDETPLQREYPLRLITSGYPVSSGCHSLCQEEVDFLLYSGFSFWNSCLQPDSPHCR